MKNIRNSSRYERLAAEAIGRVSNVQDGKELAGKLAQHVADNGAFNFGVIVEVGGREYQVVVHRINDNLPAM